MQAFLFTLMLWLPPVQTVNDIPKNAVPQNLPCSDQPRSMKELMAAFDKGRIPPPLEMTGSWVAIGFLGDGETPSFNCNGVMRGPKFEWVIHANQYSIEMDIIGTTHQQRTLKADNGGSLVLQVDFGGDGIPPYKCRITDRKTLACILRARGGTVGVEFKKMPLNRALRYSP